jgi:streptogramin lyase
MHLTRLILRGATALLTCWCMMAAPASAVRMTTLKLPTGAGANGDGGQLVSIPSGVLIVGSSPAGILRVTPNGQFSTIPGTTTNRNGISTTLGHAVVAGPDGNLWAIAETVQVVAGQLPATSYSIVDLEPRGLDTAVELPHPIQEVSAGENMALGPDGAFWVTGNENRIYRYIPGSELEEILIPDFVRPWQAALPAPESTPWPGQIVSGPDGAMWWVNSGDGTIGRVTVSGAVMQYPVAGSPYGLAVGPDGAI